MRYVVRFSAAAQRQFDKLSQQARVRMTPAIDALSVNPRPPGSTKMKGPDSCWRIRVGEYRVVYQVRDDVLLVLVVRVGHRRDVYE